MDAASVSTGDDFELAPQHDIAAYAAAYAATGRVHVANLLPRKRCAAPA